MRQLFKMDGIGMLSKDALQSYGNDQKENFCG
jgi:hypothetical protein